MKKAYPIVITPEASGVSVYIPDFDANTQGMTLRTELRWLETQSVDGDRYGGR